MKFRIALALPALLALAACEEEAAPEDTPNETGGEASGDVLEGTISDDMLPFEDLTSTSPPAPGQDLGEDVEESEADEEEE